MTSVCKQRSDADESGTAAELGQHSYPNTCRGVGENWGVYFRVRR